MKEEPAELREDRALRDTARALLAAKISHLQGVVEINSDGRRVMRIAGQEAREVASHVSAAARRHRGPLVLAGGALLLWLGRRPIRALIGKIGARRRSREYAEQP